MLVAITRRLSPAIGQCELTYVERTTIDFEHADNQHRRYEMALVQAGCGIDRLPPESSQPDSVFVEDTAIVLDELAVVTRPGAPARRDEIKSVAVILGAYRKLAYIEAPGTLDGGDVVRVGRRLFVGVGHRSNQDGIAQLKRLLKPHGYEVIGVLAENCLHLKSAVTCLGGETLLVNPEWADPAQFRNCSTIAIDAGEPGAANALPVGDCIIYPENYPKTRAILKAHGYKISAIDLSELAKAEGAVTCCSLVFERQT
ncbi:MAG: dimethylargininase [Gammaproteobacteria bacterium]|nr:dimethylargininase [Gammaproteobacteria bacterium]